MEEGKRKKEGRGERRGNSGGVEKQSKKEVQLREREKDQETPRGGLGILASNEGSRIFCVSFLV